MRYTRQIQEQLERELEHDRIVDDEFLEIIHMHYINNAMGKIEDIRKERLAELKKSNALGGFPKDFNQKQFAENVGIGYSTYKNYLSGCSDNVSLKTLLKMTHKLQCNLDEVLKAVRTELQTDYVE